MKLSYKGGGVGRIAFNKRYIFVFLSVFSLGFLSVMFNNFIPSSQLQQNASTSMEHSSDENFVPGRLLIQPKPGVTEEELEKLVQFHGSKQVGHIKQINVRILELPPQASEKLSRPC